MSRNLNNLPNELIEMVFKKLSFTDKKSIRLCNNLFSHIVKKIEIHKIILEDIINYTYIPIENIYIPYGLLVSWTQNYPFLNYNNANPENRMPAYWLAIKCCTIYNRKIKDTIINWANNYIDKYIP